MAILEPVFAIPMARDRRLVKYWAITTVQEGNIRPIPQPVNKYLLKTILICTLLLSEFCDSISFYKGGFNGFLMGWGYP